MIQILRLNKCKVDNVEKINKIDIDNFINI